MVKDLCWQTGFFPQLQWSQLSWLTSVRRTSALSLTEAASTFSPRTANTAFLEDRGCTLRNGSNRPLQGKAVPPKPLPHRIAMAESMAGADQQGTGAKREKIWMCLPSSPSLSGYSYYSKQQKGRSQAWDKLTWCGHSITYSNIRLEPHINFKLSQKQVSKELFLQVYKGEAIQVNIRKLKVWSLSKGSVLNSIIYLLFI